jgi:GH25 family lysozyme M1 (1,4-beta-N-acetylmuramidase)
MLPFIDVSSYQGDINWPLVRKHYNAAYLKASQGTSWNDPKFQANRKAANAAGVRVGAYHFANVTDGVLEAKHFLKTIGGVGPKDLKPVLDFETNPKNWPALHLRDFALKFNQTIHSYTGVWPMFYSYASFIQDMEIDRPYGNGLWIAAYGRNDGVSHPVFAPKPWKKYVAHQYTSNGTVAGIKGRVDVSISPNGLTPLLAHPVKNYLSRF